MATMAWAKSSTLHHDKFLARRASLAIAVQELEMQVAHQSKAQVPFHPNFRVQ
jgi:hypothetical protein